MSSAVGIGVATIWDGKAIEARFPWMVDIDEAALAPLVTAHGANGSFAGPWSEDALGALGAIPGLAAGLERLGKGESRWATELGATVRPVLAWITDDDAAPETTVDTYFRLHLLSRTMRRPHSLNLDGMFGLLPINAWTDEGVVPADRLETAQLDSLTERGHQLSTKVIDRFPQLTDYVVPRGVRIADASRVRLGAHLAEGTTVMHEGFVNFNAGTLGASMVEGRISAGVVVGANSDIGGGASIMGTLSGGGKEVISIGERCLLGANAGVGISLGDDCIVEAGLYVTAGMRVKTPTGETVKAAELSGNDGLLFRRNSATGVLEAVPSGGAAQWGGLNTTLQQND